MTTTKVFIPHDDLVWVTGDVILSSVDIRNNPSTSTSEKLEIKIYDDDIPSHENGVSKVISLTRLGLSSLPLQNGDIPIQGVEDMTKLNYLHEPSILDNLKR